MTQVVRKILQVKNRYLKILLKYSDKVLVLCYFHPLDQPSCLYDTGLVELEAAALSDSISPVDQEGMASNSGLFVMLLLFLHETCRFIQRNQKEELLKETRPCRVTWSKERPK